MHTLIDNVKYSVVRASVCFLPDWSKNINNGRFIFVLMAAALLSVSVIIKNI